MRTLVLVLALLALAAGCQSSGSANEELPFELGLSFEGQESVATDRLSEVVRHELVRLEVAEPDRAAIDDAAFALELFYRQRGHPDVLVDYVFEPGPPPRATFQIDEGPLVRVRELVLEGVAGIPAGTAEGYFGGLSAGGLYDQARLQAGISALRQHYLEEGYQGIAIRAEPPVFDEAGTGVTLRVVVTEGPRYEVRAIDFEGGVKALAQQEKGLRERYLGKKYLPVVRPEIQHSLASEYQRAGYPDCSVDVRVQADESTGEVRVGVVVTPGDLVLIGGFHIVGNERTRASTVKRLIRMKKGDRFDSERLRTAFRELYATGLFDSVSLGLEGTGPERTLLVELVEARSLEIRFEPGWGSYEGPRALVGVQENNFLGRAQSLGVSGTVSAKAQGARLTLVDRGFLGTEFTSEASVYAEKREEPAYKFVRRGLSFFLHRHLSPDWSTSFGYDYRPTNVDEPGFAFPLTLDEDQSSDASVAALSATLSLDSRDNVLVPTRGRQGRLRFEWAARRLGSDTEFLRAQLEFTQLVPLGEKNVIAASARTGVIAPVGTTDFIPLPERFFNGGENTVRSFKEDTLAPKGVIGESRGGEAATTLNLEWRRQLAGNLAGALFFDTGNVTQDVADYWNFDGFRAGIGTGIRYLLPIGPVRLDLGYNPGASGTEDDWVLHFSVGFPF